MDGKDSHYRIGGGKYVWDWYRILSVCVQSLEWDGMDSRDGTSCAVLGARVELPPIPGNWTSVVMLDKQLGVRRHTCM